MGKTKSVQQEIIGQLSSGPMGKKDLKKVVKAKNSTLKKKHVKRALQKLLQTGDVEKNGKTYYMKTPPASSTEQHILPTLVDSADAVLPIAERMRQQQLQPNNKPQKKSVHFSEPQVDIDDEIRRLEMELEQSTSSDASDDDETENENDDEQPAVLALSEFANESTEHLPATMLPEPGKYSSRGNASPFKTEVKKSKKQKDAEAQMRIKTDGLKEAVQEVLNGYQARSSEKLPFYCRFCAKQYDSEDDFFEHKQTDFHKTAVEMERKATYCRLCSKQLTSPAQMKEHLSSRPHKERLQAVRSRQRSMAADGKREKQQPTGRSVRQWV